AGPGELRAVPGHAQGPAHRHLDRHAREYPAAGKNPVTGFRRPRSLGTSWSTSADPARARGFLPGGPSTSVPKVLRMSAPVLPTLPLRDLDVWFGPRQVLHGIDLSAQPGRRIGLVGENGSGKSTLLRAIAGTLPSRAVVTGSIDRLPDLAMLGQEPPFADDQSVADVLAAALAP